MGRRPSRGGSHNEGGGGGGPAAGGAGPSEARHGGSIGCAQSEIARLFGNVWGWGSGWRWDEVGRVSWTSKPSPFFSSFLISKKFLVDYPGGGCVDVSVWICSAYQDQTSCAPPQPKERTTKEAATKEENECQAVIAAAISPLGQLAPLYSYIIRF